jgi:hypothetical protein
VTGRTPSGPARLAVPGYALALALAVVAPLLAPGYLLLRDAVSTPRSYLTDGALGLGGLAPRAVPQDFAVAVLSGFVDGGLVVKALLTAGLFLAGWGAARLAVLLLPSAGISGAAVAATVAVWNPFVAERLLQGHWSLLVGYGTLPWVAAAVVRLRSRPDRSDWAALAFFTALAGITPTGLILAAAVGLVAATSPGRGVGTARCATGVAALAAGGGASLGATPAMGGGLGATQQAGLAEFAARAEPWLGTLGALAGLGGIWNGEALPASRATAAALAGTVLLLAVVAVGLPAALRRPAARPLLALAAAGVLLPAALATGPGLAALTAAVDTVPGLAVLRDGQKWVALAMPGYAVSAAGAVLTLRRLLRPALAALLCCVAVIGALPDLAWGVWGRLVPVRYPPGWAAAAAVLDADPRPVAVLPAGTVRRYDWAPGAPVLDPLPRWVRAEVLATGDLTVGGRTLSGEGTRARTAERLLLSGADPALLARAGVGWVLVQTDTPGDAGASAATLVRVPVSFRDAHLTLYRVGGDHPGAPGQARVATLGAHLVWVAVLLGGAAVMAASALRRPGRSRH